MQTLKNVKLKEKRLLLLWLACVVASDVNTDWFI